MTKDKTPVASIEDQLKAIDDAYGIGMPSKIKVIEHEAKLEPQVPSPLDEAMFAAGGLYPNYERITGRIEQETATGRRFTTPAKNIMIQSQNSQALLAAAYARMNNPDMLIIDEAHFTDGRPPELTAYDWKTIDYSSLERRAVLGYDGYASLTPEEMQTIGRQRMPVDKAGPIYTIHDEPARPAIVGKPTKYRAKTKRSRKARRANRK